MPKSDATVVFIHGLAKKPPVAKLSEIWLWGLARNDPPRFGPSNPGIQLPPDKTRQAFNYYADVFYGTEYETDLDSYFESVAGSAQGPAAQIEAVAMLLEEKPDELALADTLAMPQGVTPREMNFLAKFEGKLQAQLAEVSTMTTDSGDAESNLEIASWLPDPVKQAIIKKAAMEAYYFLFDKEYVRPQDNVRFRVRKELRDRLLGILAEAADTSKKTIIVSHSMGTMVAYDVLRNCPGCPAVDTLITIGSPLGVREVQEELIAVDAGDVDFPAATLRNWINIYDPLDPVCGADPKLENDYRPVAGRRVTDIKESNWGTWRHTVTHYLAGTRFRAELNKALR